ncbi:MAG: glycosyltransferase family 1 protein [Isosphaera sp.]|nr:glycosyltransferase family 1 protein [Isosphaera sp.]
MRVLLNGTAAAGPHRSGVGHYVAELAAELRRGAGGVALTTYPPRWVRTALGAYARLRRPPADSPAAAAGPVRLAPAAVARPSAARRLLHAHFARFASRSGCDLYHEPNFIPFPCDLPAVVTVHDISVIRHPEWHPAGRVREYEDRFLPGLARAAHVIAGSEFTRRELADLLGIARERVTAVGYGVRRHIRRVTPDEYRPVLARLRLADGFLLHVGTVEPRKNLVTLCRAYLGLDRGLRDRCPLVLAGGWGWNYREVAEFLAAEGRAGGVVHLGYVAEADLPALYSAAVGLVLPSHYEGFGLPAAEMLACGGAVLSSTAESLTEVVGGCGVRIAPGDVDGWRGAMHRLIVEPEWAAVLRDGAERQAARHTWERCAADTARVYERVLGRAARRVA